MAALSNLLSLWCRCSGCSLPPLPPAEKGQQLFQASENENPPLLSLRLWSVHHTLPPLHTHTAHQWSNFLELGSKSQDPAQRQARVPAQAPGPMGKAEGGGRWKSQVGALWQVSWGWLCQSYRLSWRLNWQCLPEDPWCTLYATAGWGRAVQCTRTQALALTDHDHGLQANNVFKIQFFKGSTTHHKAEPKWDWYIKYLHSAWHIGGTK